MLHFYSAHLYSYQITGRRLYLNADSMSDFYFYYGNWNLSMPSLQEQENRSERFNDRTRTMDLVVQKDDATPTSLD